MTATASTSITAEQLKDILAAVITEARKPVQTEKDLRDIKDAQDTRVANAELVKQQAANKKYQQDSCTHMRKDGTCRAVFIKGSGPDVEPFMICQGCQDKTWASKEPAEFNRLFQLAGQTDMIF